MGYYSKYNETEIKLIKVLCIAAGHYEISFQTSSQYEVASVTLSPKDFEDTEGLFVNFKINLRKLGLDPDKFCKAIAHTMRLAGNSPGKTFTLEKYD